MESVKSCTPGALDSCAVKSAVLAAIMSPAAAERSPQEQDDQNDQDNEADATTSVSVVGRHVACVSAKE